MNTALFVFCLLTGVVLVHSYGKDQQVCGNDEGVCEIYETCCAMKNGTFGCCPYIYANCCKNFNSCCQSGFECNDKTKSCVRMKPGGKQ
ncbi:hypothetical protein QR680_006688 [Steinernema hermaphroditum]|uniref:Granulins domain-containing protein n=1 Tax=Steinernema hermaphroditum TaxID=289476 RepID=A0AA39LXI6_9BILA|nr:hypothetical protein QR680_006688 [Steinernema hermaphroditum]